MDSVNLIDYVLTYLKLNLSITDMIVWFGFQFFGIIAIYTYNVYLKEYGPALSNLNEKLFILSLNLDLTKSKIETLARKNVWSALFYFGVMILVVIVGVHFNYEYLIMIGARDWVLLYNQGKMVSKGAVIK